MAVNIPHEVEHLMNKLWTRWVFRAVVTGTSGERVFIQRPGQSTADSQAYARLASYTSPTAGHEVIVIWLGGYIILGRVLR